MKYHKPLFTSLQTLKGTSVRRSHWHAADGQRRTTSYPIEIARIPTAQGTIMLAYCLIGDNLLIDQDVTFQKSKYPDTIMEFSL